VDYANVVEVIDVIALRHEDFTHDQTGFFDQLCPFIEEFDAKNALAESTNRERMSFSLVGRVNA
jgi:hypothetical protein